MKFLKWLNRKAYNAKCHLIEFKNFIFCKKVEEDCDEWGGSKFYVPLIPETDSEYEGRIIVNELLDWIVEGAFIQALLPRIRRVYSESDMNISHETLIAISFYNV